LPVPLLPVLVFVNGRAVQPRYLGAAPGLVAGITQVNVQVPLDNYSSNQILIVLGVNVIGQGILYIVR
jgi:uncharacterized protein (TIGR03437 family)